MGNGADGNTVEATRVDYTSQRDTAHSEVNDKAKMGLFFL
jgi:hypothetical protein